MLTFLDTSRRDGRNGSRDVQPSLRDGTGIGACPCYPAMNRWAIVNCPSGTKHERKDNAFRSPFALLTPLMQLVPSEPWGVGRDRILLHAFGDLPQHAGSLLGVRDRWRYDRRPLHQQFDFRAFGQIALCLRHEHAATVDGFRSIGNEGPPLLFYPVGVTTYRRPNSAISTDAQQADAPGGCPATGRCAMPRSPDYVFLPIARHLG